MQWKTGAVLAGLLALGACKGPETATPSDPAAAPQAAAALAYAGAAPAGLEASEAINPEDGDLVGTELHGNHAEVAAGTAQPRDLPRLYPETYAKWQSYVARTNVDGRGWVDSLDATSTALKAVSVDGVSYIKGWVCERHNCPGNDLVFLMSADQSQIVGFLRLTLDNGNEVERVIGPVKPAQLKCMRVLIDDEKATRC